MGAMTMFCLLIVTTLAAVVNAHPTKTSKCTNIPASVAYHGTCFFQYTKGRGYVRQQCPYGTRYNQDACACISVVGSSKGTSSPSLLGNLRQSSVSVISLLREKARILRGLLGRTPSNIMRRLFVHGRDDDDEKEYEGDDKEMDDNEGKGSGVSRSSISNIIGLLTGGLFGGKDRLAYQHKDPRRMISVLNIGQLGADDDRDDNKDNNGNSDDDDNDFKNVRGRSAGNDAGKGIGGISDIVMLLNGGESKDVDGSYGVRSNDEDKDDQEHYGVKSSGANDDHDGLLARIRHVLGGGGSANGDHDDGEDKDDEDGDDKDNDSKITPRHYKHGYGSPYSVKGRLTRDREYRFDDLLDDIFDDDNKDSGDQSKDIDNGHHSKDNDNGHFGNNYNDNGYHSKDDDNGHNDNDNDNGYQRKDNDDGDNNNDKDDQSNDKDDDDDDDDDGYGNQIFDDYEDIYEKKFDGILEYVDKIVNDLFNDDFDDFYEDLFDDDGYDDCFVKKYDHYFSEDYDDELVDKFDDVEAFFARDRDNDDKHADEKDDKYDVDDDGDNKKGGNPQSSDDDNKGGHSKNGNNGATGTPHNGDNDDSSRKEKDDDADEGIWSGKGEFDIFDNLFSNIRNSGMQDSRLFNFEDTLKGKSLTWPSDRDDNNDFFDDFYKRRDFSLSQLFDS